MSISETYSKTGDVLINVLDRELRDASIPIDGAAWIEATSQVRVDYDDASTSGDRTAGAAIVAAHVPIDPIQEVADVAETNASNIPGWSHWTESEAETWWDTNIDTPIASAPTVTSGNVVAVVQSMITVLGYISTMLWAIARMVIALRDKQWPNLSN